MTYQTLQVRFQEPICFLRFHRPEANNTINSVLIEECSHVLSLCEESITVAGLISCDTGNTQQKARHS